MDSATNTQLELESVSRDAQSLSNKIGDHSRDDHATIRAQVDSVAEAARKLGLAIRSLLDDQATEGRHHLEDALTSLKALYEENRRLAVAEDADVQAHADASFAHAREAANQVSQALDEKRGLATE